MRMSFNEPPLLHTKNHAPTIPGSSPLKAWTLIVVWTDANYAVPFKGISIRSTPEIVLYLNEATVVNPPILTIIIVNHVGLYPINFYE